MNWPLPTKSLISRVNVEPTPFYDSTVILPPNALANALLIDNPSPQPYLLSSLLSMIFL
jgi:hypothetical protein